MRPSIPVTGLSDLFLQTADAAVRAQLALDTYSLERSHVFTIPSVDVKTSFKLGVDVRTGVLALLFGSNSEQIEHSLQFTLRAAPVAPPDGDLSFDLPCDRRTFHQPPWMVAGRERQHLCDVLTTALRANRCIIEVPGLAGPVNFYPEAQAIDEALRDTDNDGTGVVFFRLSASPAQYLIVRFGHSGFLNRRDGIFLLSPDDDPPVTVFDFATNSKWSPIAFHPIYRICAVLSQWQMAGMPGSERVGDSMPDAFGSIRFADFVQDIWASYVTVRKMVAVANPAERPVYALTQVSARFAHAMLPSKRSAENTERSPYIYSRVALQIAADRLEGHLVCPEYVLVEGARAAFLAQLAVNIEAVSSVAEHSEQDAWRAALSNSNALRASVITLSYESAEPGDQFLVVFPAAWAGCPSWFSFTCAVDKQGLKDITRRKSLADLTLDRDGYIGFHNFWHSIRVWEMAESWFASQ